MAESKGVREGAGGKSQYVHVLGVIVSFGVAYIVVCSLVVK